MIIVLMGQAATPVSAAPYREIVDISVGRPGMAASRDQAARIVRAEREPGHGSAETSDTSKEQPVAEKPVAEKPVAVAPPVATADAAAKPGKRKFVLMGILALAVLAGASYGVHYFLVGRFFVGTDDAYVRANNTTLGARVSGHIAAILPRDNALVKAGDVVFKIDDGD
jgi:membrane fusion protein (multidrug efflux system)